MKNASIQINTSRKMYQYATLNKTEPLQYLLLFGQNSFVLYIYNMALCFRVFSLLQQVVFTLLLL